MLRALSDVNEDGLFGSLKEKVSTQASSGTGTGSSSSEASTATASKPQRSRQLIILVGPQGVSMESTMDFFIHHMSQYRPRQHLEALEGWIWPAIELPKNKNDKGDDNEVEDWKPVMSHRQMLDLLIQSNNDDLRLSILQQINATWAANNTLGHKGMVLGSPFWDEDPTIVYEIVSFLQVPPKDVTVIWVYPSSRYHQWQTLFHASSMTDNYTQWMCDPNETPFHLERLDTSLNAMRYATAISSWGINGVVIDQRGVLEAQLSIPHSIACRVMTGVPCHSGWVEGLDPVVLKGHQQPRKQQLSLMESPISWLEQVELEGLLADRDCYYRTYLLSGTSRFRHLFPSHLWADCEHEDAEYPNPNIQDPSTSAATRSGNNDVPSNQYYESLVNTTFLWLQLRNNVPCDKASDGTLMPPILVAGNDGSSFTTSDVQQRVESSLQSSVRAGIWTVSVFLSLLALWIVALRRRVRQRRCDETQILRQWNHNNAQQHQFDLSTVKACHLSGRYDDEDDEDFVEFDQANSQNLSSQGGQDDVDDDERSSSGSIRLSYRDEDFDEIDLQYSSSTNICSGIMI